MNKTRYCATEFGRNKPMNFRPSGTLIEIWIHLADACVLAMSCVGYARARVKTLSSLLKLGPLWRERVSARSFYYFVYRLLFTRKGLPHLKYDISSESTPTNIVQVERFSKRLDEGPSHDSISAFPLQFDHEQ